MTLTDEQLIAACQQNNRQAQKIVFEKYAGKLMVMCHRYFAVEKAEKILEHSFQEFFEKIPNHSEKVSDLLGFLKSIAFEHIKKELLAVDVNLYPGTSAVDLTTEFKLNADANRLLQIISELDETKRFVVNFKVFEGMSIESIANFFSINVNDVERIYNIAMKEMMDKASVKENINEFQEERAAQQV